MPVALVDPFIETTAADFWGRAGGRAKGSVDFVRTVALSLPLDVVVLSRLSVRRVEDWLARRGVEYRLSDVDRSLYGLLTVYRGVGFVFLDGTDDEPTRRFTLAHEVAHFLLHYLEPRQRAIHRLGSGVVDVLDGLRTATHVERLAAIISDVDVYPYVHLLNRADESAAWQTRVDRVEGQADQLALELLAPAREIAHEIRLEGVADHFFKCVAAAERILCEAYELPPRNAGSYARRLAYAITGGPSLITAYLTGE